MSAGRNSEPPDTSGATVCEHLKPVDDYIRSLGVRVYYVGAPWSRNCRTWIYYDGVVLDGEALRARFNLPDFVVTHLHRGTHDGAEQGLVCERDHDELMGSYPELSSNDRVIR